MPKKTDASHTYKIRGIISQSARQAGPGLQPAFSLVPGSARDGTGNVR